MEHQVNDDKEHHDSDDVSGIQGFASWTSVLGKPYMDVSAAEYVISPSIIDASLTSESLPARDGFGRSSRGADALQSPDHDQVAVRVANGHRWWVQGPTDSTANDPRRLMASRRSDRLGRTYPNMPR